jgi:glycosyl hydrolase family 123
MQLLRSESLMSLLLLPVVCFVGSGLLSAADDTQSLAVKVLDPLAILYGPDQILQPITPELSDQLVNCVMLEDLDRLYQRLADVPARGVIRMVAPRNGRCSGQVVACGPGAASPARIGPLRSADGTIPPEAIDIRYLTNSGVSNVADVSGQTHPDNHFFNRWYNLSYYDQLNAEPPRGADLVPIWVTVAVPQDATPGLYTGVLTVCERDIPIELTVSTWTHPRPEDFTVHNGHFLHSPETVALRYNVGMWSPEHILLMEKSLYYMGLLGNRSLIITAQHQTHLGNQGAMIPFRQAEPDGAFSPDFSVMNTYLDAYQRHVRTPEFITLYVWEPDARLRGRRKPPKPSVILTRIVDGKPEQWAVPLHDSGPDGGALGALLRGFRDEIRKRGWDKTQILIGMCHDTVPSEEIVARFRELAPWCKWARFSHYRGDPSPEIDEASFATPKYLPLGFTEEVTWPCRPSGGWDLAFPRLTILRRQMTEYAPLSQYRNAVDYAVGGTPYQRYYSGASLGLCRWAMDYWDLDEAGPLLLKYETNRWRLMYRPVSVKKLMAPGPDGPVATTRLEMLLEGLQETEARIALEKALRRDDLAPELREEIGSLLARRIEFRTRKGKEHMGSRRLKENRQDEIYTRLWGVAKDWPSETVKLFDLADRATRIAPEP